MVLFYLFLTFNVWSHMGWNSGALVSLVVPGRIVNHVRVGDMAVLLHETLNHKIFQLFANHLRNEFFLLIIPFLESGGQRCFHH